MGALFFDTQVGAVTDARFFHLFLGELLFLSQCHDSGGDLETEDFYFRGARFHYIYAKFGVLCC